MIVILCDRPRIASTAFQMFLEILMDNEPWTILRVFEGTNCLETDENLRYIFIDRRLRHVFDNLRPDVEELHDFLNGLLEFDYIDEEMLDHYEQILKLY